MTFATVEYFVIRMASESIVKNRRNGRPDPAPWMAWNDLMLKREKSVSNIENSDLYIQRTNLQRKLRRDLTFPESPFFDKGMVLIQYLLKFQLIFVFTWMLGSAVSPKFGKMVSKIVSPFAEFYFFIQSNYDVPTKFNGGMGNEFYKNIVGETFFMGVLVGMVFAVVYCGRYIRKPWRFIEFGMEQWGLKSFWLGSSITIIVATPLTFLVGFILCAWYGAIDTPYESGTIKLHQLGLWSIFSSTVIYLFIWVFMFAFSSLCYLIKLVINKLLHD